MKAIELLKKNENEIRKRFGVRKIGMFGSFARGEEMRIYLNEKLIW